MRTFHFAPFHRSNVGLDRLFSMLDQVGGVEGAAAPMRVLIVVSPQCRPCENSAIDSV
jgi:hypothetical protein